MPHATTLENSSGTIAGLLLLGGGGHCRSVIEVLEAANISIAGIIHGPDCALEPMLGHPALGRDEDLPVLRERFDSALVTVGQIKSAAVRRKLFDLALQLGFRLPVVASPHSRVSPRASLGAGSIVMHGAHVNSAAVIGRNCTINSGALVEHDCRIGDHCHIAVNATLCGEVRVGAGSFVGAGAVVREGVTIGENCVVGMHCGLRRNLGDGEIYVG